MSRRCLFLAVLAGVLSCAVPGGWAAAQDKPDAPVTKEAPKQESSDIEVLAVVNGERITRKQVADQLILFYGRDALNWFIDAALVEQEARKNGVTVAPEEIQPRISKEIDQLFNQIMAQYRIKSKAELAEYAKRQGGSLEAMRQRYAQRLEPQLRPILLMEKLLRQKVTVTPEEVRERYEKKYGPRLDAQQIVVADKKEAEGLVAKIREGADFAILAREHSLDAASKGSGGKLQPLTTNSELGRAMAGLKEGEVSDPVPIGENYHILKLNKRIGSEDKKLSDVEAEVRAILTTEKTEALQASWRAALKDKADIRILTPLN